MSAPWLPLAIMGGFALSATVGDLISQEIRGRLDGLPRAILLLAARRLPDDLRAEKLIEWEGELHVILRGVEALPVTRLWRGLRYAAGIIWAAPTIARTLTDQGRSPNRRKDVSGLIRSVIRPTGSISLDAAKMLLLGYASGLAALAVALDDFGLDLDVLFDVGVIAFFGATFLFVYARTIAIAKVSAWIIGVGVAVVAGTFMAHTLLLYYHDFAGAIVWSSVLAIGATAVGGVARRARRLVKARRQRAHRRVPV